MQEWDLETWTLVGISLTIMVPLFVAKVFDFFSDFAGELRYLNNEIRRSMGEEQRYWIRQRSRLWLSLIPFVKY